MACTRNLHMQHFTGFEDSMPITYTPIATITANGTSNAIVFSSLPAGFTDLRLVANARVTGATASDFAILYFNGDTSTSSYSSLWFFGNGSSATGGAESPNYSQMYAFKSIPGASAPSGAHANLHCDILNYKNTSTNKTVLVTDANPNTGIYGLVGTWRNTAAITSVGINCVTGNWTSTSVFTLFGIKAA